MNQIVTYVLIAIAGYWILSQMGVIYRLRGLRSVDARTAQDLVKQGAVVLDVRTNEEYSASRIPAARHIPLHEIRQRVGELESLKERPIVVNCRSGSRSARACLMLKKNGFEAYNLKGGLAAWVRAGMGVER